MRTPEKLDALCQEIEKSGGNITHACRVLGITRQRVYEWSDADPDVKSRIDGAVARGADSLEDEARRRAFDGVDEPVFYKGEPCGTIRKYSDTLIIFLLKGARPEKYRERFSSEVSGPGGGPIAFSGPVFVLPDDGSAPPLLPNAADDAKRDDG